MIEQIRAHDRYLDPPEIPEFQVCDRCREKHQADDLIEFDYGWYCSECIDHVKAEAEEV